MKDPYKILGLDKSATDEEIKKTYRKLAMEHHPDRTGGDDTRFKEIAEAYSILSDPKKKARLNSSFDLNSVFGDDIFEDFLKNHGFGDMFNNRYGWSQNGKGRNVQMQLQITLDEAYNGAKREIRLGTRVIAIDIPTGVKTGQRLKIEGLGQRGLTEDLNGDLLVTILVMDHPDYMIDNKGLHKIHRISIFDAMLGGKSTVDVFDKKINFTIPKCTQNGAILRIQGKGFPIFNQYEKYGDLYINILVELPKDLTDDETSLIIKVKDMINGRK
jgi:curved DNA-binding protein